MVRRRLWSRLKGLPTKTPVESIDLYAFVVAWSDFVGAIFNPVCTGVGLPNSDQTWLGAWERTTCRRKIRARRIWSSTLHTWRPWRVNCMTWAHHIPCDAPSDISCFRDFRACASWWRILKVPSCQARKGTTVLQLAEDSLRRPQGPGGRGLDTWNLWDCARNTVEIRGVWIHQLRSGIIAVQTWSNCILFALTLLLCMYPICSNCSLFSQVLNALNIAVYLLVASSRVKTNTSSFLHPWIPLAHCVSWCAMLWFGGQCVCSRKNTTFRKFKSTKEPWKWIPISPRAPNKTSWIMNGMANFPRQHVDHMICLAGRRTSGSFSHKGLQWAQLAVGSCGIDEQATRIKWGWVKTLSPWWTSK